MELSLKIELIDRRNSAESRARFNKVFFMIFLFQWKIWGVQKGVRERGSTFWGVWKTRIANSRE